MFRLNANDYIYSPEIITKVTGDNLYLPIEVDTEYAHLPYDLNNPNHKISTNLTVQCRVKPLTGIIYAHPDIALSARHKVFKYGFAGVDYLEDNGYKVELSHLPSWDYHTTGPWLQIDIYSFFAVAELARIFKDEYLADILFLSTNPNKTGIDQARRLRTYTQNKNQLFNWTELPWLLVIDGVEHRVRIAIYDTCAVHGIAGYAHFCSNSGVKLPYKDNFTSEEKSIMNIMYRDRPDDFDNYALGDLYNHD